MNTAESREIGRLQSFRASLTPGRLLALILSLFPLVLFMKVVDRVLDGQFSHFDIPIIQAVYACRQPWLTPWVFRLTALGDHGLISLAVAAELGLVVKRKYKEALFFVGVAGGGFVLSQLLKLVVARPRPTISPLAIERTFSFPSGHSMNSFIIYILFAYGIWYFSQSKKLAAAAAVLAAMLIMGIGFSRVYLGVHYPSDVLGGYLAGAWWLSAVYSVYAWRARKAA